MKIPGRLRRLLGPVLLLLLAMGGTEAYAIPEGGSIGVRTFSADGHAVPFTDIRVRLVAGDYPQETVYATTNIAGTRWVSVNVGTYEVAALDADGTPLPDPVTLFVPSGAHDIIVYLIVPSACHADVDASGDIGFGDLLVVLGGWGPCPATCPGDITGDGAVDFADLLGVMSTWGPCPAAE